MIKKYFVILLSVLVMNLSTGCSGSGTYKGDEYKSYGLFDEHKYKNPKVEYEVSMTPIVFSVLVLIFLNTFFGILAFIITIGWFLNVPTESVSTPAEDRGRIE